MPRATFLPYSVPSIGEEEIDAVVRTMRSGFLSAGPSTRMFEEQFAAYVGARHAIAVSSCTCALELALAAAGVGPGHEVIVPTLTFAATANVVERLGAKAVLVDVNEDLQVSAAAVLSAITEKTRAIVPVHYGGQACELNDILQIGVRHRIPVIQDAAHAVGGEYAGRGIGGFEGITGFSFYPSKNMTTGEGGMLTLNDDRLAGRIRELALHGIRRSAETTGQPNLFWNYEVVAPGYKGNLPAILAAIGIEQLKKLDRFIARRREIAARYSEAFSTIEGLIVPCDLAERPHAYHLYTVRVTRDGFDRNKMLRCLQDLNIGASVHFIPLHRHPYYASRYEEPQQTFPNAETIFRQMFSLPIYPAMSDEDVEDVAEAVKMSLQRCVPARSGAAA